MKTSNRSRRRTPTQKPRRSSRSRPRYRLSKASLSRPPSRRRHPSRPLVSTRSPGRRNRAVRRKRIATPKSKQSKGPLHRHRRPLSNPDSMHGGLSRTKKQLLGATAVGATYLIYRQKNNTEQALVDPNFIKETYQITLEEGFCSLSFLCVRLWTLLKQQPVFAPQINSYLRVVSDYTSFISLEDIRALNKKHGFSTVGTSRDIQPIKETTERLQIHKLEHLSQFCTLSEIPKHKHKQSGNNALEYINREINFWKSPFNESFRETLVATKWNTGDAMHLLQETGITLLESTLKKPNTGEILKQRITGLKQYISEISNDTFHDDDEYARRTFNNNNVNIHLCVFLSDKSNEYQSAAFDYYKSSGTINSEYSAVQQIYDMK